MLSQPGVEQKQPADNPCRPADERKRSRRGRGYRFQGASVLGAEEVSRVLLAADSRLL